MGVFLLVTVIALAILRHWVAQNAHGPKHGTSNIYALEGKRGFVTKELNPNQLGQVTLNGEIWSARTVQDMPIVVGTEVTVLYVRGAHLVVEVSKN